MVRKLTGDGYGFAYKVIFRISKVATCGKYTEGRMTEVGALYLTLLFVFIVLTVVKMKTGISFLFKLFFILL